jgi:MYXO-CTERM domain-containing protein
VDALTSLYAGVALTERDAEPTGGCAQVDGTTSTGAGLLLLTLVGGSRRRRNVRSSPR